MPAILDGFPRLFRTAKNTTRNEVQQVVAAPESRIKFKQVFSIFAAKRFLTLSSQIPIQ